MKNPINAFWGHLFPKDDGPEKHNKLNVLSHIPLFDKLTKKELRRIADIIYDRTYSAGEYIFEKSQPGAAMFIIKTGTVKIVAPDTRGNEVILATLGEDTFFGELALLDDSPRSASARAEIKTEALAFFRSDLIKLLDEEPDIASNIFKALAYIIGQRLKATNEQLYGKEG